ncbi:hypothetical protein BDN71DRAFT_1593179 [Pleurotus eryngii]|uniref:F-box domain-containing protein n=1 Tax=Pleurotus eryngii TaxID=5323 RepID=A0A9P5ZLT7_PLEER|nr:hypothetical protein BDN71DRAFT_1593179 [Pleurotus eryngii]
MESHRHVFDFREHPMGLKQPELPIELIGLIIAHLYDHADKESVQACSLVCSAWNELCRRRLFRAAGIMYLFSGDPPQLSFLQFTPPHLYKYITDLTITWCTYELDIPTLPVEVLNQFPNICSLHINASGVDPLPALFIQQIMDLLSNSRVKLLDVSQFSFFMDASNLLPLLSQCSSTLEELILFWCSISGSGAIPNPTHDSKAPLVVSLGALRRLRLIVDDDLSKLSLSRLVLPNLEVLSCSWKGDHPPDISRWGIVRLSELILIAAARPSSSPRLGQTVRPSSLTITVQQAPQLSYSSIIKWIADCILSLPFPNDLRRLNINIGIGPDISTDHYYPTFAEYEELHRALRPLCTDCTTKHININFATSFARSETHADFGKAKEAAVCRFREAFAPPLEANRQLTIDMTFNKPH